MSAKTDSINLTNHFLIAMPGMADPIFAKSLTFICEHNDKGAIGLIVNRALDLTWAELFNEVNIRSADKKLMQTPVQFGGPVMPDRGFVLHEPLGNWASTLKVDSDMGLTTSRDILESIARGDGPTRAIVTLGYAGWGPMQLEDEFSRNGWLSVAADPELIFGVPIGERLNAAMGLLGLDFGNFSDVAGHA